MEWEGESSTLLRLSLSSSVAKKDIIIITKVWYMLWHEWKEMPLEKVEWVIYKVEWGRPDGRKSVSQI